MTSQKEFIKFLRKAVSKYTNFSVDIKTENEIFVEFKRYGKPIKHIEYKPTIAFPIIEDGIINCSSGVVRVCGTFLLDNKEVSLYDIFIRMLTGKPSDIFPNLPNKPILNNLINGIRYNSIPVTFRGAARAINFVINKLPLRGTLYEKWAMSNRVMVIDPTFDSLPPYDALEYQTKLNKELFPWTSLGLSDSGMCNNALLKVDLRKTVPFARRHHNPHRNLYQTLGMRGDEGPWIKTETEVCLEKEGIKRGGWNLRTLFLDLPENFEDQIIISSRLKNLKVQDKKRIISWGIPVVSKGDVLKRLYPISIEPSGDIQRFDFPGERAWVSNVEKRKTASEGLPEEFTIIEITLERSFKDGFKLTNRHGNKGVVWLTETGYVEDPQKGKVPIDVIVSASSVKRRKNFGQLFEALCNLILGKNNLVIPDNKSVNIDKLTSNLSRKGYNEDGTCKATTPWGEFRGIFGEVFWGVIKTPEDQVWHRRDVIKTDNKGYRTSGNKLSHIEMKALTTWFGPRNPVVREFLEYQQGNKLLTELFCVCQSILGKRPSSAPVAVYRNIKTINQSNNFLHDKDELEGTIADIHPDGFLLELPFFVKISLNNMMNTATYELSNETRERFSNEEVVINRIYVPSIEARTTWAHPSGKIGLEDTLSGVNNLIRMSKGYADNSNNSNQVLATFEEYIKSVERSLSTKNGKISDFGMAVRYPLSAKATAMLGHNLPRNIIQIHASMAKDLEVKEGDIVLVERFPCLGFMSIRPQRVTITSDDSCKYVIRVSGNSLNSLALDFDGDVLFIMSLHTREAKKALGKGFFAPPEGIANAIEKSCNKKVPKISALNLSEYGVERFPDLTASKNAEIVKGLTGIKRGTGTIVALCYNLMRIIERKLPYEDIEASIGMELLLDVVANSVFSRKHAGHSLEKECREAISTADFEKMVQLGLGRRASKKLCEILKSEAEDLGVKNLKEDFEKATKDGKSIMINRIIRKHHKIWFASRANLPLPVLAKHLNAKPVDLASHILKKYLSNQTKLLTLKVENV